MRMLRLATAGSVDDGKSSLIGRLLYDSKSIFEDQLLAIEEASARRGAEGVELALLTDGLRAEREQNITIDVAYRYFNTPKRKFIIADTPGHVQYTRNMVTGTSTADLSVILVDARKGVLPQSKRHAAISGLLRVPEVLVAVNKMDLVEFSSKRFAEIEAEFRLVAARLHIGHLTFIPISALLGDNVVDRSENMPWYHGPTFLQFLEEVDVADRGQASGFRLPIQYVIRPTQDYRGLAGEVSSGNVSVGDAVTVLPAGVTSTIKSLQTPDGPTETVAQGQPVVIELADNVDASRGDLITDPKSPPTALDHFEATICWMGERELVLNGRYQLLHTTRRVQAFVVHVKSRIDIEELSERPADRLAMNDIGRVIIRTTQPLFIDSFAVVPSQGSFVLIDESDYGTVGAGLIENLTPPVDLGQRVTGHVIWLTGGSATRRSSLASSLGKRLGAVVLDELILAEGLNEDRPAVEEAERRLVSLAQMLASQKHEVVISAWSPSRSSSDLLEMYRMEEMRIGTGENEIPESADDDWIVDAILKRYADGI